MYAPFSNGQEGTRKKVIYNIAPSQASCVALLICDRSNAAVDLDLVSKYAVHARLPPALGLVALKRWV